MSLRDDLINIKNNVSAVLDGCNMTLKPEVSTLLELPARVGEMHNAAYNEGFDEGEATGLQRGEEFGRLRAWDEFWDAFQDNGNRTVYSMAFAASYWNDNTLRPKYKLNVNSGFQMFYGCGATALPVEIDTSNCNNFGYMFCSSKFVSLPVIDMRNAPSTSRSTSVFYGSTNLVGIEKVYLHGGDVGDSFQRLPELVEIRLEGELVSNVDLSYSSNLSRESIESFVAALSDTITDKTLTFSQTAVNAVFTTDEWEALVATKPNWTIVT